MKTTKKRSDILLDIKTRKGAHGTYIFFCGPKGDYHAFVEVAAKEAARDCGIIEKKQNGKGSQLEKCAGNFGRSSRIPCISETIIRLKFKE